MNLAFLIFLATAISLCVGYLWITGMNCIGWIKTKNLSAHIDQHSIFISVIIAARNEENTILNCLDAISNQSLSEHDFEIIVVDDSSSDSTNDRVASFCKKNSQIRLITLSETDKSGKKAAISEAIRIARGELIVTTDADCVMKEYWLAGILSCYRNTGAKMIVAPVCFHDEKTVFQKMQSLEFMALIASGGGALFFNKAIMCNGANLAFTKNVFLELNGYDGINEQPSGDDVLLMYKISRQYPKDIRFLKAPEAIVYTNAKAGFKEFFDQRRRWASKKFSDLNNETKAVSLVVYLFNLILVLCPVLGVMLIKDRGVSITLFVTSLILFLIKCIIDFLLLFLAASFFRKKRFLIYFLPEQLIYIFYVAIIGLLGKTRKYEWRGRTIK